jgi:flavin-dependent dehydrogenase
MRGKHVVIVGFGPAGALVAIELANKVRLTIVSNLDAIHHNMCVGARWGLRGAGRRMGGGVGASPVMRLPRRTEASYHRHMCGPMHEG